MRNLLIATALLLSSNLVTGQSEDVAGIWIGEWSNHEGFYFTFSLNLEEQASGLFTGAFIWRLEKSPRSFEQPKLGTTAVEYVRGTYNTANRKLTLQGFRKDDPHQIIGIDRYELTLSENAELLAGATKDHGTWKGVFYAARQIY